LNCFSCDKACREHVDFSVSKAYLPTPQWLIETVQLLPGFHRAAIVMRQLGGIQDAFENWMANPRSYMRPRIPVDGGTMPFIRM
jgi:hypothetical protein